jgi:hypothetical protein
VSRIVRFTIIPLSILLLLSCSEKSPPEDREQRIEAPAGRSVTIVFDLPGDDIGGPEYKSISGKIKADIESEGAGEVISFGYGMGSMEIVVLPKGDEAMSRIKIAVMQNYPEAKYRIEHQPGRRLRKSTP